MASSEKLLPSGQVLRTPLHRLVKSAKGRSDSLFPAVTTTANFLVAGITAGASRNAIHRTAILRSHFQPIFHRICIIPFTV